jgi:molybdopterin-guanine dinucleotide biosynthesis protein A
VDSCNDFTGIILAGGQSSRLGQDKGLLNCHGITLAQRAVDILSCFCTRVIIITGNPEYKHAQVELVPDIIPGKGPLMGLYSGLKASRTADNLVLAVDNCFVNADFYTYLLPNIKDYDAVVPGNNGKLEPLVGFYSRRVLPVMDDFIRKNNYKPPDLLSVIKVNLLKVSEDFPSYHENYFKSINLKGDLKLLDNI